MYRIIYLSTETKFFSKDDVNALLINSKSNNLKFNITGLLIYIDGDFLQVIEGKKEDVINLFELIKTDIRHKHIICVFNGIVPGRQFPEWSMGFSLTNYNDLRKIEGFHDISKKSLSSIIDKTAITFIDVFAKSHRDEIVFT
jgi:hypothetical protein